MIERERRENFFHRVSIRKYEDRPVEDENRAGEQVSRSLCSLYKMKRN